MQPPTRDARRNGSGIASGRGCGGSDGACAGTADESGRQTGRPNKNRPAESEPGCREQDASDVIGKVDVIGEESAVNISAEEANPASTVLIVRAEVRFVLRVVALGFLTLVCRKRLLGET